MPVNMIKKDATEQWLQTAGQTHRNSWLDLEVQVACWIKNMKHYVHIRAQHFFLEGLLVYFFQSIKLWYMY